MGLLNFLGLDDLADSVSELTSGIDELRDEFISSVVGPGEELKNTVDEIAGSIKEGVADITPKIPGSKD